MSMFLLPAIAGVTVQLPRICCTIAAAAPGCPAMALYCADCAYRPNKIMVVITPSKTPSGIRKGSPANTPTSTNTTIKPTPLPNTIGRALGSVLRIMPATMAICLKRPGVGWSAVAPLGALVAFDGAEPPRRGIFTMAVRIRLLAAARETRSSCRLADPPDNGADLRVPQRLLCLPVEAACPVGRPDQRARHHAGEPEFYGQAF